MTGWLNMKTPPNVERKANTCPQTIPKSRRGENTPKLIPRGEHSQTHSTGPPKAKTLPKKRERELQANISDEYQCKNPQQNY